MMKTYTITATVLIPDNYLSDCDDCNEDLAEVAGIRLAGSREPDERWIIKGVTASEAEPTVCPVCENKPCDVRDLANCPGCHGTGKATN